MGLRGLYILRAHPPLGQLFLGCHAQIWLLDGAWRRWPEQCGPTVFQGMIFNPWRVETGKILTPESPSIISIHVMLLALDGHVKGSIKTAPWIGNLLSLKDILFRSKNRSAILSIGSLLSNLGYMLHSRFRSAPCSVHLSSIVMTWEIFKPESIWLVPLYSIRGPSSFYIIAPLLHQ